LRRIAILIIVFALLAAIVVSRSRLRRNSHSQTVGPRPGLLAPEFRLPRLDGQPLSLASYRGKVVLLDFWATWCVPCREETPHFVALQQKYRDRGLQIIGVSMDDSPDPVGPFVQQFRINYPVVIGTAQTGVDYGGVLGLPIAFVIDRDGRIVAKHIGATDPAVFEREVTNLLPKP